MTNGVISWWSDERTEELKTRWANGESGSQICLAMGARSRNAVVGKAYRLQLQHLTRVNGAQSVRKPRVRRVRRQVNYHDGRISISEEPIMVEETPPIFENPKPLALLGGRDCRWPGTGSGWQLLFCAAPQLNGYSYCAAHCRIAYVRPGATPKAPRS